MIASFLSPAELSEKGLDGKKLFMACLDETAELGAHFARFTCFTGRHKSTNTDAGGAARCSVCLLYWYKSTNTDAEGAAANYLHKFV